ncbi:S41 family peptidase [Pedobacter endophyticus]|uniref:Carboxyl-terminal protease n=1 Tax=Pedobacter endophyticus TaxID=2789740 RepID=A0A7U3SQD2_9SPHI|nr:S41 family peptidase [Pedobacter endophyticus]QPH38839.1 carboxyl-terminal protease [Pedobacter endophyticus]
MLNTSNYSLPILVSILLWSPCVLSCKKENNIGANVEETVSPTTGTRTELTIDSIFLYAKQIYLWNEVLPAYKSFLPREKYVHIAPEIIAFKKELFDISQLKINLSTGVPYEKSINGSPKYSYLQAGSISAGTSQAGPATGELISSNSVIESGGKKIAYVALTGFPKLIDSKAKLDDIFARFSIEKPKYLIIDLRNNRGGYVETAEYVVNLIAPSTLNGKVMYSEQFNSTLQTGKASILKHQPYLDEYGKPVIYKGRNATMADVDYTEAGNTYRFDKKGTLETVEAVYIIVSGRTASASELLISCLKPYINVKLVGESTYGKPVGFFAINIDQYAVYLSSFFLKNAQGWSEYFNGMEVDIPVSLANDAPFGDVNEPGLKTAIAAIVNNGKPSTKKTSVPSKPIILQSARTLSAKANIQWGAFENRLRLKP